MDTPAGQVPGRVMEQSREPRLYRVEVPSGEVRRNQCKYNSDHDSRTQTQENTKTHETSRTRVSTRSWSGIVTNPPNNFGYI